jgi:hypothetical protein
MYFLRLLSLVVLSVGALISVLSIYLLLLSIYLLLQKNTRQLENLLLLGYTRAQLVAPYVLVTALMEVLVLGLSLLLVFYARSYYVGAAERLLSDEVGGTMVYTLVIGLGIFAVTSLCNALAIRRKIHSLRLFAR